MIRDLRLRPVLQHPLQAPLAHGFAHLVEQAAADSRALDRRLTAGGDAVGAETAIDPDRERALFVMESPGFSAAHTAAHDTFVTAQVARMERAAVLREIAGGAVNHPAHRAGPGMGTGGV